MANETLKSAKKNKNDEFYTQLCDIEKELSHYKEHFKGKTVLCNCDDPRVSNFFRFFALKFKDWGIKRLITTCYKNQDVDLFSQNTSEKAVWLDYYGNPNDNTSTDFSTVEVKELKGDGDFRSKECIELLKQADIVVTNPPFSLFREYVAQLIEYDKKFLIIGNKNALTYKEIFKLIKNNHIWTGYNMVRQFIQPDGSIKDFGNICWFTNMLTSKRIENLILTKTYNPIDYPKYDHYDAIEVSRVVNIPKDYTGIMGVPITFIDKYNPDQFEILGDSRYHDGSDIADDINFINGKGLYRRILIRRK